MKRIISILLCAVLAISLVACKDTTGADASSVVGSSSKGTSSASGSSNGTSSDAEESSVGGSSSTGGSSSVGGSSTGTPSKENSSTTSSAASSVVPTVNNYKKATYNLAEITDYVHVTGRTDVVKTSSSKTGLLFDYAAQGLLFKADCEGDITISFELKMRANDTDGLHYYTVYIDGVKQDRISAKGTPGSTVVTELKVASGLKRGVHTIEVYRNHEALLGISTLLSVTMNGVPQKWVSDPNQLRIEFLGDSITSGTGVYGTNGAADQSNIKYYDGTAAYAFIASKLLNAEASIVSRSGMTIAGDTGTPNMYNYYTKLSYERNKATAYDHSKMDVDLYVISLGANDTNSNYNRTAEQITTDAKAAMAQVRKDHPNAKILWVYGQLSTTKASAIKTAVEEMGGEAKGFYYYRCTKPNTSGSSYHPNAKAQQIAGEEVAAYIKTIFNLK